MKIDYFRKISKNRSDILFKLLILLDDEGNTSTLPTLSSVFSYLNTRITSTPCAVFSLPVNWDSLLMAFEGGVLIFKKESVIDLILLKLFFRYWKE